MVKNGILAKETGLLNEEPGVESLRSLTSIELVGRVEKRTKGHMITGLGSITQALPSSCR